MLIEKMFYDITKQQWQDMVKDCDTEKEILSKKIHTNQNYLISSQKVNLCSLKKL